jgi:hypothetical protein
MWPRRLACRAWSNDATPFSSELVGDTVAIATKLFEKYVAEELRLWCVSAEEAWMLLGF